MSFHRCFLLMLLFLSGIQPSTAQELGAVYCFDGNTAMQCFSFLPGSRFRYVNSDCSNNTQGHGCYEQNGDELMLSFEVDTTCRYKASGFCKIDSTATDSDTLTYLLELRNQSTELVPATPVTILPDGVLLQTDEKGAVLIRRKRTDQIASVLVFTDWGGDYTVQLPAESDCRITVTMIDMSFRCIPGGTVYRYHIRNVHPEGFEMSAQDGAGHYLFYQKTDLNKD